MLRTLTGCLPHSLLVCSQAQASRHKAAQRQHHKLDCMYIYQSLVAWLTICLITEDQTNEDPGR